MTWDDIVSAARQNDANGLFIVKVMTNCKDAPETLRLPHSHAIVEKADSEAFVLSDGVTIFL